MEKEETSGYIKDILLEIKRIGRFTERVKTFEEFKKDEKTMYACIRSFEIMREAAKRVSSEAKKKFPLEVWGEMAGMRDKLIHDYGGVDFSVVWKTIKEDLPVLKKQMEEILDEV